MKALITILIVLLNNCCYTHNTPYSSSKHDTGIRYINDEKLIYGEMLSLSDSDKCLLFITLNESYENNIIPIPYQEVLVIRKEDTMKHMTDIDGMFHTILDSGKMKMLFKNPKYYLDTVINLNKGSIVQLLAQFDNKENKLMYLKSKEKGYKIRSLF